MPYLQSTIAEIHRISSVVPNPIPRRVQKDGSFRGYKLSAVCQFNFLANWIMCLMVMLAVEVFSFRGIFFFFAPNGLDLWRLATFRVSLVSV